MISGSLPHLRPKDLSRVVKLGALTLACLLGLGNAARAQSLAGLGALSGSVRDTTGGTVANAEVEVANPALGIDRKITTNADGLFAAPSLPPADGYTVTVRMAGFATNQTTHLNVHVGEQITVPVQLTVASGNETVSVSADVALLDPTKTELSALVNQAQIQNLPINGRRVDQFSLLTPGVVQDGTTGELSFHGIPSGNQFLQDGVDVTQQWFVQNAGGGAVLSNISMDAVQEFRTEVLGYSAEFGRGAGGVVNTLTKSGTNDFHGSGFWFFRNRTLNAIDLFSKLNGQPYNAPEYRHQFGGSVGGPIIKDKLFFFSNYEGTRRNFPLVSSIINPSILNSTTHQILPGLCTASVTQCAAVQTYFNRYFTGVPRSLQQNIAFAKFDFRPSEKSSYTANFNLVNYNANNGGTNAVAPTDASGFGGNYNVNTHIRNARLSNTYLVSGSAVNEFRFGFNADRRFQGLSQALIPPNGLLSGLTVAGQANLGVSANQLPNIQPTEKRFDLSDNFSQTIGKHQLKYGVDLAYLRSVENAVFNGPGTYTYTTLTNFAYDLTPNPAADPGTDGKHWSAYAQALGHPITGITIRDYDFFVQDQWQATRALSLNLGLRYEYATYTQPPLNPDYPATGAINQPGKNFAPRVGFAYNLNDGKTIVRGNYGIFYNRLPGASITRLQQLGGVVRKSFTLSNGNALGPNFPNRLTSLSQVASLGIITNSGFAKPGLATPYVQEANFGVEQSLGKNTSVNVSYIFARGLKFLQRSDLNIGQPTGVDTYNIVNLAGAVTGTYSTPTYLAKNRIDPRYGRVLQIDNAGRIWYDGLAVELRQRLGTYLQSTLAYTFSHSEDLGQGTASSNYYFTDQGDTYFNGSSTINGRSGYAYEKGSSLEDQRHRLVLTAIGTLPRKDFSNVLANQIANGWQLAPIFTYATPQFVDSTLTVSTANPLLAYTSPTLSGVGGESPGGIRAPFLPTANLPLGHTVQLDGRLTKRFPLPREQNIELSFEAINALNHIRYTGVNQVAYKSIYSATGNGTITQQPGVGTGSASGGFPDGTNARRAQASLRYTF